MRPVARLNQQSKHRTVFIRLKHLVRATWVSMNSFALVSTAPRIASSSLARISGSLARVSPIRGSAPLQTAAAAAATTTMGRGGDGLNDTVSASGVVEGVGQQVQHPVRVNPRSDKFGVQRFHHIEFWTADATAAAKR